MTLNFLEYLWIAITSRLHGVYLNLRILKVFAFQVMRLCSRFCDCESMRLYGLDSVIAMDSKRSTVN